MPPVTIADTAIAHSPSSTPKRGPNAAPASTIRKKIPLPPPSRPSSRSKPAARGEHARGSRPIAPVIVPRRTSSAIATTTSPPTIAATSGASPECAAFGSAVLGSQNG